MPFKGARNVAGFAGLMMCALLAGCTTSGPRTDRQGGDGHLATLLETHGHMEPCARELSRALAALSMKKGDTGLLILSNAGQGRINGRTTEAFSDIATEVTGCSRGRQSLFTLHDPAASEFWFALFRKDTRALEFCTWTGSAFESERLRAAPEILEDAEAFRKARSGLVGAAFFGILSFSHAWSQSADWDLLRCAEFHNHCCGGVTSGYLAARYVLEDLPLRAGERYTIVTASPSCAMDALQVMLDTTTGKKGMFSTKMDAGQLSAYTVDGVRPMAMVVRRNAAAGTCDGVILGFDYARTGQTSKLWDLGTLKGRRLVRVLKRFKGDADLADALCETGVDPYGYVWER